MVDGVEAELVGEHPRVVAPAGPCEGAVDRLGEVPQRQPRARVRRGRRGRVEDHEVEDRPEELDRVADSVEQLVRAAGREVRLRPADGVDGRRVAASHGVERQRCEQRDGLEQPVLLLVAERRANSSRVGSSPSSVRARRRDARIAGSISFHRGFEMTASRPGLTGVRIAVRAGEAAERVRAVLEHSGEKTPRRASSPSLTPQQCPFTRSRCAAQLAVRVSRRSRARHQPEGAHVADVVLFIAQRTAPAQPQGGCSP